VADGVGAAEADADVELVEAPGVVAGEEADGVADVLDPDAVERGDGAVASASGTSRY
jgi:hypothetical protein